MMLTFHDRARDAARFLLDDTGLTDHVWVHVTEADNTLTVKVANYHALSSGERALVDALDTLATGCLLDLMSLWKLDERCRQSLVLAIGVYAGVMVPPVVLKELSL